MIDLSKNTNPYYPSKEINKKLHNIVRKVNIYPLMNTDNSEKKLSKYFNISHENIHLTRGTLEAFDILLKELKIKKIGFLVPTFWGMKLLAEKNNCTIIEEKIENDYSKDQINNLAKRVDMIYLCNPNNPTLSYISQKDIINIIKSNPDCYFVVDETLLAFSPLYKKNTLFRTVVNNPNLTVLISFSKIFSLGGLRIAVMFSSKKILEMIKNNRLIFSSSIFTEKIIEDLGKEYFKINREKFKNNFKVFLSRLNKKYVDKYVDKNVSFVLIRFKKTIDISKLTRHLKDNNYIIADISSMYLELEKNWVRISIGKRRDLIKLARIINKYLEVHYE